jgi:hypothetical protein
MSTSSDRDLINAVETQRSVNRQFERQVERGLNTRNRDLLLRAVIWLVQHILGQHINDWVMRRIKQAVEHIWHRRFG